MWVALHLIAQAAVILRVLLRPHRNPASRISWVVVVLAVPVAGILGYLLLGETSIGRRRAERMRQVRAELPAPPTAPADLPERHAPLFRVGESISGYPACSGNAAALLPDSNSAIDALVADIDAATDHVHLVFYIWLPDGNGTKVAHALMRAARRGVACRAMVDDLGSKLLIRHALWRDMAGAGVRLGRALPIGNPLLRPMAGRIDLRNHRKLVVVDGVITWCGSQNCADPEFRVKPRYAPWVDVLLRFEGPVARQNQHLFASDWMAWTDEDLTPLLTAPMPAPGPGFPAQVVASGPTSRHSAMPEMFQSLIYAARRELVVTTPYYVPDDPLQAALCAAANRGVATTIVFPARNDNWAVAAASRSCYAELLAAGVVIHEFEGGLLHAKTLTLDGEVALVGSANMDRRSFDLNYENTILLADAATTALLRDRQAAFIARSRRVTADEVAAWPWQRRLWNNAVAVMGPVL
ncbi:cardiolipin synthase [Roseomonas fluvialis]|uniref:Cardiolipin synthase n=1 Tax=Roseomonas fluvialis TaxID=1750527 RepID=A0ABN6P492_9PROT|nr:cardiolipin synthase [Roseomonas fluvialis]BDG73140.1 cardiolipin synthase A [Roseomonas fluvialis]